MTEVSKLYLTEKEKTLILLALDTHMVTMHNAGCYPAAIQVFSDLSKRMVDYDAKLGEECATVTQVLDQQATADLDWQAHELVASFDDETVTAIYEACVARLVEDADEVDEELDLSKLKFADPLPTPLELYIGRMKGLNVNVDNPRPSDTEARDTYYGA